MWKKDTKTKYYYQLIQAIITLNISMKHLYQTRDEKQKRCHETQLFNAKNVSTMISYWYRCEQTKGKTDLRCDGVAVLLEHESRDVIRRLALAGQREAVAVRGPHVTRPQRGLAAGGWESEGHFIHKNQK